MFFLFFLVDYLNMENIKTNSFIERIDSLLLQRNEKRLTLTESMGITHSALSDWKKRGTIPSGDICVKMAKYFGVSVEWLITGNQEEIKTTPNVSQEAQIFSRCYDSLTKENQKTLQNVINALHATEELEKLYKK